LKSQKIDGNFLCHLNILFSYHINYFILYSNFSTARYAFFKTEKFAKKQNSMTTLNSVKLYLILKYNKFENHLLDFVAGINLGLQNLR
jgi:hypothetical protein